MISVLPATRSPRSSASGQMSSVRAGSAVIVDDPAAIVVALADQPALEPPDVDFLIDAFLALPEPQILVPRTAGSTPGRSPAWSPSIRSCCAMSP